MNAPLKTFASFSPEATAIPSPAIVSFRGVSKSFAARGDSRAVAALQGIDARLGQVRSAGLFLGLDVVDGDRPDAAMAAKIVNGLREARVLISATGPKGHVLKIRPPLVFSSDHVAIFAERLAQVMAGL